MGIGVGTIENPRQKDVIPVTLDGLVVDIKPNAIDPRSAIGSLQERFAQRDRREVPSGTSFEIPTIPGPTGAIGNQIYLSDCQPVDCVDSRQFDSGVVEHQLAEPTAQRPEFFFDRRCFGHRYVTDDCVVLRRPVLAPDRQ